MMLLGLLAELASLLIIAVVVAEAPHMDDDFRFDLRSMEPINHLPC